jgi:hypothetical protein
VFFLKGWKKINKDGKKVFFLKGWKKINKGWKKIYALRKCGKSQKYTIDHRPLTINK